MKKEKREELYQKAIEKWGVVSQIEMLNEESIELALAVRKFLRKYNKLNETSPDVNSKILDEEVLNLIEEMVDVEIMMEQLCYIYPSFKNQIQEVKDFKLQRLEKRINK